MTCDPNAWYFYASIIRREYVIDSTFFEEMVVPNDAVYDCNDRNASQDALSTRF